MAAVFEKIKAGQLSLDTQIRLTRRDRVGGSGSLKWVRDGTSLSVMEIIFKMITESDNTATRMLIDTVGMDYLSGAFKSLGLAATNITQEGMSLTSGRVARENYTTPREMASLLERIYAGELVSKDSSEFMLDVLKHTKSRSRLRKATLLLDLGPYGLPEHSLLLGHARMDIDEAILPGADIIANSLIYRARLTPRVSARLHLEARSSAHSRYDNHFLTLGLRYDF